MSPRLAFLVAALLGAAVATSALGRGKSGAGRSSASSAHAHFGHVHFGHRGFAGGFYSSTSSAPLTAATVNAVYRAPSYMPPPGHTWCPAHNIYYPPGVECPPAPP